MSDLVDAVRAHRRQVDNAEPQAWRARIVSAPDGGKVDVVVYDQHPTKRHTAPYTPHPGPVDPEAGDRALVIFDNDGKPWVVMWHAAT
jgi:hypothetical protein